MRIITLSGLFFFTRIVAVSSVPVSPLAIQTDKELQLWNELDNACSSFLSIDSESQASSELEDLCYMIMGILPKPQESDEKDNTKRFLFHYSKTHNLGNSDVMSSVIHPLLQLIPQLHERRMKRFKVDVHAGFSIPLQNGKEELQGPGRIQSRGYFLFRPRNGRRSTSFH